ncbi:MAG: hypothetical protein ISR58_00520 [Anaerolineales bacterium]|nr:hypothetical protein [Chloroflexota bacterium]MBL6979647.1 hypothetical protein [Anaerolineales bacterium]
MNLYIRQDASPSSEGWWDWAIWLEGSSDDLEDVAYVEYVLHPTFPNPVQKVTNRDSNFRLSARGWGEFNIKARVHFEEDDDGDDGDNDNLLVMDHWLELDEIAPAKEVFRSPSKSDRPPRLYLSSAVADIEFAYSLKEALEDGGVEVLLKQDMGVQNLSVLLQTQRRSVQAGLLMVSDMGNPWMVRDYMVLAENKISSMVVQIGASYDLPEEVRDLPRFQIKDISETEQVAPSIARRVLERL